MVSKERKANKPVVNLTDVPQSVHGQEEKENV